MTNDAAAFADAQRTMRHARAISHAFEACANNDVATLAELLHHRRVPSSTADKKGNTLLHIACAADALDAAKVCVKYAVFAHHPPERAYVSATNANGERAIDVARACGSVRCERWLEALTLGDVGGAAPTSPSSSPSSSRPRRDGGVDDLSDSAALLLQSLLSALMVDEVAEDEDARARAVLARVGALVADREALRKDLLRAKDALAATRSKTAHERAEERDAVFAALQLAEERARTLHREREDAAAETSAIARALRDVGEEAEALRQAAADGASTRAIENARRDAYGAGYAAGWKAALKLPSREYVRAQLKLEKDGDAPTQAPPTDEFMELSLRDDDAGHDASAHKENASLASRASMVLRESYVAVKHRVTELERVLSSSKNAAAAPSPAASLSPAARP